MKAFKYIFIIFLCVFLFQAEVAFAATIPSNISGLSLWLKADIGVFVEGGLVSSWADQSGNHNLASQADISRRPVQVANILNGKPSIRFLGSQSLITNAFLDNSFDQSFTFFIVNSKKPGTKEVSTSQGMNWKSSRDRGLIYNTESLSDIEETLDWIKSEGVDLGVETFRYDGKSKLLRFSNGTGSLSQTEVASGSLGLNGALTIGGSSSGADNYEGDIAEIIIYKKALSDIEISEIENYLIAKYGIKSDRKPQIIFDGDSLTVGTGSTPGKSYPQQTIDLLGGNALWAPANYAVEGQTVKHMNTDALYQLDSPVNYDALKPQKIVAFLGGTNDLSEGETADVAYERIVTYGTERRKAGYKVIISTILPRRDVEKADFETERQKLNSLIRKNWKSFADELSDIAGDPRIGDKGDENNLKYYIADGVHLTDDGYAILASSMANTVNRLIHPKALIPKSTLATTTATTTVLIASSSKIVEISTSTPKGRFFDGFLLQWRYVMEFPKTIYLWIYRFSVSAFGNWHSGI